MSASKKSRRQHEWTAFEKHTLLCLMAKNMHTSSKDINVKKDIITINTSKSQTYMDVTTALNKALHGNRYELDISYNSVRDMIDLLIKDKRGVLGPGGSMERFGGGRVTRARKLAWDRTDKRGFLGSVEEWDAGRRYKVMNEYRKERGLQPLPEQVKEVEDVSAPIVRQMKPRRSAAATSLISSKSDGAPDVREGQLASFERIPLEQRSKPEFNWRQPKGAATPKIGLTPEDLVLPGNYNPSVRTRRYISERKVGAKSRFAERNSPPKRKPYAAPIVKGFGSPLTEAETLTNSNATGIVQTPIYMGFLMENETAFARNSAASGSTKEVVSDGEQSFGRVLTNMRNGS